MPVEVVIDSGGWNEAALSALAARATSATLQDQGLDGALFEVVVMGCDDARIRALNADFRAQDKPTNVLSWPSVDLSPERPGARPEAPDPGDADDPEPLGDIALAWETCQREAREQGKSADDHTLHLLVHSVLHLLGYDHIRDEDAAVMEETEVRILGKLGVADPYAAGDGAAEMPAPPQPMETER